MRKIILTSLLIALFSVKIEGKNFVCIQPKVEISQEKEVTDNKTGFPIHKSFTASNGCIFSINGEYTILTGNFTGTISINCPGQPSKNYYFSFVVPATCDTLIYESGDEEVWGTEISVDTTLMSEIAIYLCGTVE